MTFQFSADELSNMRAAQSGHMLDLCIIQTYARTYDSYGEPVDGWTDATSAISCGLDMRPGREVPAVDFTSLAYDATVRLPIGTVVDAKDHIKITYRFGEALSTPLIYRIEGPIQRGPSGLRITLRRVEV